LPSNATPKQEDACSAGAATGAAGLVGAGLFAIKIPPH